MWAQISGHSSVQSSSTLGLRKARQPICILRSKKIEQGQLLYPKIFPPISFKKLPSQASKSPKGCTVQGYPRQSKLGFWFWSRKWSFQRSNQVSHAYKYGQASSYQVSRLSAQNCTVKTLNCTTVNCRGKMVIWQSKVQIFGQHIILKPQTSFDQCLIMILKIWLRNHQDAKVSLFGQLKKSTEIDQGITFTWIIRKIPSKAHFEEKDISYNSSSYFKSKKWSHKKLSISTL